LRGRDPKTMKAKEFERWSCSPYVSSIAYSIKQVLPGAEVRVRSAAWAEGEGAILTRVRMLLWLVTGAGAACRRISRRGLLGGFGD